MKGVETTPHGMRGICKVAVVKRIGHGQIAIFIMDARKGNRELGKKSEPDPEDNEEKGEDRQRFAFRQTEKKRLNGVENFWREARQKYGKKGEVKGHAQDRGELRGHAHQQNVNEVTHRGCEFSALDCGTREKK